MANPIASVPFQEDPLDWRNFIDVPCGPMLCLVPYEDRTPEVCLRAVQANGLSLNFVPGYLRTYDLCKCALMTSIQAILYTPVEYACPDIINYELFKSTSGQWPWTSDRSLFDYLPEHLLTAEFFERCVAAGCNLRNIPLSYRTQKVCEIAVECNPILNASHVPRQFMSQAIIEICLQNGIIRYPSMLTQRQRYAALLNSRSESTTNIMPKRFWTAELCRVAVENNSQYLPYIPRKWHTDELYLAAVKAPICGIDAVPGDKITSEMREIAVGKNGRYLASVPHEEKTEGLCLKAVSAYWGAIMYVPESVMTSEIIYTALRGSCCAFMYIQPTMITADMCQMVMNEDPRTFLYVPYHLQADWMYPIAVKAALKTLHCIPIEKKNVELCVTAVNAYAGNIQHVPSELLPTVLSLTSNISNVIPYLQELPISESAKEQFLLAGIRQNPLYFCRLPEIFRTEDLCRQSMAMLKNPLLLREIPVGFCKPDLCRLSVAFNPASLEYVPVHVVDLELCKIALTGSNHVWDTIPERFKPALLPEFLKKGGAPREMLIQDLSRDASVEDIRRLTRCGKFYLHRPEFYDLLHDWQPWTIHRELRKSISRSMNTDLFTPEFCLNVADHEPSMIQFLPKELRTDEWYYQLWLRNPDAAVSYDKERGKVRNCVTRIVDEVGLLSWLPLELWHLIADIIIDLDAMIPTVWDLPVWN